MRILIINHYAGSPYHGMVFRHYYLALEWIKSQNEVTIVAASNSHTRKMNPEVINQFQYEVINGINYIWVKTIKYQGNGLRRILNMIQFLIGLYKLIPLMINKKPDIVIASSTYPLDNYPAYCIAKKINAKYVYEVRDLWPLSPIELGSYSKYHPFVVLMQIAENFAYKHVNKVVSLLPCAEQYMKNHGLCDGKFVYIPNGIVLEEVENPDPLNETVRKQIPEGKFLVGYCGTMGLANSVHIIIESAKIIEKINPEIYFILIGTGPEKDNLITLKEKYALQNIQILDAIPKKQVQSLLGIFDSNLLILQSAPLFKYGISSNKIFDYMYSAKPVIQAVNAGNDIVGEARCGLTVQPENPLELAHAIQQLYTMSDEERNQLGQNGKEYVLAHHTYNILAQQFLQALQE